MARPARARPRPSSFGFALIRDSASNANPPPYLLQKRLSDFAALASIRPMDEPAKSKKPLIVVIILLLIFAGLYVFVLSAYKNESNNRAAELTADTAKAGENRI